MKSTSSEKSSLINSDKLEPKIVAFSNKETTKDRPEKFKSNQEEKKSQPVMNQHDVNEKKTNSHRSISGQESRSNGYEIESGEPYVRTRRMDENFHPSAQLIDAIDIFFEKIQAGNANCLLDISRITSEFLANRVSFNLNMHHPLTLQTPLTTAITGNHAELVEELLAIGCSAKIQNGRGESPLEVAVMSGDYLIVRALLASKDGPSLLFYPSDKLSVLVCRAAALGHSAIVEEFIAWQRKNPCPQAMYASTNDKSLDQKRQDAKFRQQEEAYDYFFHGKPKIPTGQGAMLAALSRVEGMQLLREKDRAYLGLDKALGHAALAGRNHVVQVLAAQGADLNAFGLYDATALSLAAGAGHTHIVDLLIKLGADINLTNTSSLWPLLAAVKGEHEEVVRLLINHGADTGRGTYFGLMVRQAAQATRNRRILDLLK